jgi:hypothetical protein
MRITGANAPNGKHYTRALHAWIDEYGFKRMDKQTRYAAIEMQENLAAISAWRETLPEKRIGLHTRSAT